MTERPSGAARDKTGGDDRNNIITPNLPASMTSKNFYAGRVQNNIILTATAMMSCPSADQQTSRGIKKKKNKIKPEKIISNRNRF